MLGPPPPAINRDCSSRSCNSSSSSSSTDGHAGGPPSPHITGHLLGVLLIVLVACIWVAASQLIEAIFKDLSFDKPYFLTYFNTCGFSLWLLGALCSRRWQHQLCRPLSLSSAAGVGWEWRRGAWTYAYVAACVCPGWMLANYLFNLSLDSTSVASNSVLSTTSNVWTMILSACLLHEPVDPVKLAAVTTTVSGAVLVAAADASSCSGPGGTGGCRNTPGGDLLALLSACMYAVYTVMLKALVPDGEQGLSMPIVFGFIGALVLLCGWPVLALLDVTGWETFQWPGGRALLFLALNALVGTNLSDVLWARAVQLTRPLVATLGLSLTIPFGMVSDAALHGKRFSAKYVAGATLVFAGFVLGSVAEHVWSRLRCQAGRTRH